MIIGGMFKVNHTANLSNRIIETMTLQVWGARVRILQRLAFFVQDFL